MVIWWYGDMVCLALALAPSCAALHFWCLYIMLSKSYQPQRFDWKDVFFINPHVLAIKSYKIQICSHIEHTQLLPSVGWCRFVCRPISPGWACHGDQWWVASKLLHGCDANNSASLAPWPKTHRLPLPCNLSRHRHCKKQKTLRENGAWLWRTRSFVLRRVKQLVEWFGNSSHH